VLRSVGTRSALQKVMGAAVHMIFKHIICDTEFLIPAYVYLFQYNYTADKTNKQYRFYFAVS
jgi:hypothetical protein